MLPLFNKKNESEAIQADDNAQKVTILFERDEESRGSDNKTLLEEITKHNDVPIFKGQVENAYESDFLGYKDKCPLCQTPTQQMYSNFVWTNQAAARLMAAPAGHFCPNCPTVIIDDDLMKASINKARFQYWGTVAIETGFSENKDDLNLFKTFNGIKPTYILDENEGFSGIINSVHQPTEQDFYAPQKESFLLAQNTQKEKNKKEKNKKRNKQAKQSRKANRKK